MVPNFISLLIDQMRGTSHESQTAWIGCLDRRTNQSCPHRRTHQSCINQSAYHWSQTSIAVSESVPLVPGQSQPNQSQRHSMYHSHWSQTNTALTRSQSQSMYHWSQTSLNRPEVSVIVCTTLVGHKPVLH